MNTVMPSVPQQAQRRSLWLLPVGVFVLLAALAIAFARYHVASDQAARQAAFENRASQLASELGDRLKLHEQFLRTLGTYFAAHQELGITAWRHFAERIGGEGNLPGMVNFGYAARVSGTDLNEFTARVERETGTAFKVHPQPGPSDGETYLVSIAAPSTTPRTEKALGFNLASEGRRRQAIELAGSSGETVLTAPITLVLDTDSTEPGFLMLRPVYRTGLAPATADDRRKALVGVVFAAYRGREFMASVYGSAPLSLAVSDAATGETLYTSAASGAPPTLARAVSFGQRDWALRFSRDGRQADEAEDEDFVIMVAAGFVIAALVALSAYLLISQRQRAEAYARTVTGELRAAEAAIRDSDKFKQEILDAATEVSIIATTVEGTITLFNRGAEKMLGYPASELIGRATPAAFHDSDEIAERGRILSAELGQPICGFQVFTTLADRDDHEIRDWTYVRADGQRLRVSLRVTAQRDPAGAINGYLGVAIDISERLRAESELKVQHGVLANILSHLPVGVSLIDRNLNFIAANQKLKEVLDFPNSLFANGPPTFRDVALFNARRGEYGPGDPEVLADAVIARAANPQSHKFERVRPNGRVIEVTGTPLSEGGFVTIYADVTERRQADAELRQHRDHLQDLVAARTADLQAALNAADDANRSKSEFLANMSHELRTPMHAILSFSALGIERSRAHGEEKTQQYFERIRQSAQRLLGLVNDLLDLSRLEAHQTAPSFASVDVLALAERVSCHLESLAVTKGIIMTLDGADAVTEIEGDAALLERLIHNLLANAIKFSPDHGVISVSFAETRCADIGDTPILALAVADRGPGVPEEEAEAIFEKFVQSTRTKSGAGGTGLGLAICREIVGVHHGRIRVANNPQGGATFTVLLPNTQSLWRQA